MNAPDEIVRHLTCSSCLLPILSLKASTVGETRRQRTVRKRGGVRRFRIGFPVRFPLIPASRRRGERAACWILIKSIVVSAAAKSLRRRRWPTNTTAQSASSTTAVSVSYATQRKRQGNASKNAQMRLAHFISPVCVLRQVTRCGVCTQVLTTIGSDCGKNFAKM